MANSERNDLANSAECAANLSYLEITVLEVIGAWPAYVDGDWTDVVRAIKTRVVAGEIRLTVLLDAARFEPSRTATRLQTLISVERDG